MKKYLQSSLYIDWHDEDIRELAVDLSSGLSCDEGIVKTCFEWVRDNIKHSYDARLNPVTCKASAVLFHKTGYCYAKSHLLAALLRANEIPAGLCYQRLRVNDDDTRYCLHGLNAVFLQSYGWYRIDARGNKKLVDAQFSPPREKLAFAVNFAGEADLPEIWPEPLPVVIEVLNKQDSYEQVYLNLPDIDLWSL